MNDRRYAASIPGRNAKRVLIEMDGNRTYNYSRSILVGNRMKADLISQHQQGFNAAGRRRIQILRFKTAALLPCLRTVSENMSVQEDPGIKRIGTDGFDIYYNEAARPVSLPDYQHMILHCLFSHMAVRIGNRIIKDLACDMASEYLRAELFKPADAEDIKRLVTDTLPEGCDPHLPKAIARGLMELREDELDEIISVFRKDDHRYWYECPKASADGRRNRLFNAFWRRMRNGKEENLWEEFLSDQIPKDWAQAFSEMEHGLEGQFHFGLAAGSREEKLLLRQIGRYDFSGYLRRFSYQREEIMLDLGSFDYIPYYYGLEQYGNLPFIEPLEYAESSKVEELVIAIDTSGSCHKETVERFLAEIEKILMNKDTFFRRMNIHIIQCDSIIQDHTVIHSREEWKEYLQDLSIKGRGGTDFCPVFRLVEKIQKEGGLKKLKGLLYFTDGDGVYPREKPPYETAFVFTDAKALGYNLPEWIVKLCLDLPAYNSLWSRKI